MSNGAKVIFLDRDGTINIDHGFVHAKEQWEFTPGAVDGLHKLKNLGYKLAVITNQSGIAAGLYTEDEMRVLHKYMQEELAKHDAKVDVIAYCPHARDGHCDCRKPATGMSKKVEAAVGDIDYANSWTIGDKFADLMFGKTLGTHTILVRSKYWQEADLPAVPDAIVDSLLEAADFISKK